MNFRRKDIRLEASQYVGRQWYFLTLCTEDSIARFRDGVLVADLLALLAERARLERFDLPAYCFMPDHLHVLVNGTAEDSQLLRFAKGCKQRSGYLFEQKNRQRLWQKKYYEHILRPNDPWESVAWYIWMNPVRGGLCARPQDWPFSGSFTVDWRKFLAPPEELWVPPWRVKLPTPL